MCGICGIASTRGAVDPERLARCRARCSTAAPTRTGVHIDGGVGIAARRLAIIDLDRRRPADRERGRHASSSSRTARSTTTASSRASSSAPATASARAATPRCSCTATRSGATRLWERLRGMFAVAVWDARHDRLVLARDRFGIKPLYYRVAGGELSFASELDALDHGAVDLDALEAFLTFNSVPAPLSIFEDIRKLSPGHTLTWSDGQRRRSSATRAPGRCRRGTARTRPSSSRSAARACATRCARTWSPTCPSASCSRAASTPGTLAALAAEESSEAVRTFSIGFEEASFDELAGARAVAARYGTIHRELTLRPDAALLLPALADAFDEPFADSSALPDLPRLEARGRGREGRALRRGERRALRRLLHLRRRPARRARRPARLAGARRSRAACRPPRARVSFDYKAKRFTARRAPAAARAPPRLEGDLLRRRARRAARPLERLRPARDLPRPASPRPRATSS